MRIGLQVPHFDWPGGINAIRPRLAEIARVADEVGFDSLWVMDHFFQIEVIAPVDTPMLEGYTTLGFLASITEQIKLGTLVTGVVYRHPGILIKTVSTLDVLSGGRAYFGIGAAWYEREALGLGVPYPVLKERFAQLEETLQIAKQMWAGDRAAYHGKHYHLAEPINNPQPLSRPHPPIMIGGGGEQKTLRLVAQYADACNLFLYMGVDTVRKKLDILRGHCETLGRPYDEIERTALGTVHLGEGGMTPAQVIAMCREVADAGIQHLILNMPTNVFEITPLEIFGREIIPEVAAF